MTFMKINCSCEYIPAKISFTLLWNRDTSKKICHLELPAICRLQKLLATKIERLTVLCQAWVCFICLNEQIDLLHYFQFEIDKHFCICKKYSHDVNFMNIFPSDFRASEVDGHCLRYRKCELIKKTKTHDRMLKKYINYKTLKYILEITTVLKRSVLSLVWLET